VERVARQLNAQALKDLVEGGSVPFKTNSRSYVLTCPMCAHDKLYVERTSGRGKCFRCEWKGWADFLLAKVYSKAVDELADLLYGTSIKGTDAAVTQRTYKDFWGEEDDGEDDFIGDAIDYPPELAPDPEWVHIADDLGKKGREYLEGRGIPAYLATEYGVMYHRREMRVIFPAVVDGLLRGWQGRYIRPTEVVDDVTGKVYHVPKAKTTGKIGGKLLLWQDRLKGLEHGVLVEGPIDCIKAHMCGGNVCSLGKDVSQQQVDILLRSGIKRLYVGLDRDAPKDVERIVRKLNDHMELYRLLPPPHRDDLGDCTFDEVFQQYLTAPRLFPGMLASYLKD
jgi:DNA primase